MINDQLQCGPWQKHSISELPEAKSATIRPEGADDRQKEATSHRPPPAFPPPKCILHISPFTFLKKWIMPLFHCLPKVWRIKSKWAQTPFQLITSKIPLSNVTLNHFQFPSLSQPYPSCRPLLKSINPYNWPILSVGPDPQPMKNLPFLRTHRKCHLLSCPSCRNLDSIRSYYKGWPACTSLRQV